MGLTHADIAFVRDALEERSAAGELVMLLNAADDPVIERLLTPRIALTVAEDLAFEQGHHVLVVHVGHDQLLRGGARGVRRARRRSRPAGPTPATCTATWPACTSGAGGSPGGPAR